MLWGRNPFPVLFQLLELLELLGSCSFIPTCSILKYLFDFCVLFLPHFFHVKVLFDYIGHIRIIQNNLFIFKVSLLTTSIPQTTFIPPLAYCIAYHRLQDLDIGIRTTKMYLKKAIFLLTTLTPSQKPGAFPRLLFFLKSETQRVAKTSQCYTRIFHKSSSPPHSLWFFLKHRSPCF